MKKTKIFKLKNTRAICLPDGRAQHHSFAPPTEENARAADEKMNDEFVARRSK